jgi:hypothetical protein
MAARGRESACPRPLLLAALLLGAAAAAAPAAAQSQGYAVQKLQQQLQPAGWQVIDAAADACQDPGAVSPGVICEGSAVASL